MKVLMTPNRAEGVGGISTVIAKYHQHLPERGIELVSDGDYDVEIVHAGAAPFRSPRGPNVAMLHGLYWTAEFSMDIPYRRTNQRIVDLIRTARVVTVPSEWVAATIRREFHIEPFIVPHGVDADEWQGGANGGYVLWAKNNDNYLCTPQPAIDAARRLPHVPFRATFGPQMPNYTAAGRPLTADEFKDALLNCGVYLATTPETWGIATVEALAAGKPVVGYRAGYQPVLHKVTGYLADPGDVDDLARGIEWALANYDVLSGNARALSKQYSWDNACELLIPALEAAEDRAREGGVTIVIPYYRKGETALRRAIDSATAQDTSESLQIVVVDDASDDGVAEAVCASYSRGLVRYIGRPQRGGVAEARNTGVAAATGSFVTCLDADDAITPDFVSTCVRALKFDASLGVVYTGLGIVYDDGTVVRGDWPGEFNFWAQAEGRNQVPTCCMFRKEAWARAGGYRARYTRYALAGYGTEDAELWLHIATLGYQIRQVSNAPLFHYRGGGSTANPDYTEIPWHNFYDYGRDYYPIGAPLHDAHQISWPVRIYDPPRVSVIIPVGPGHEGYAQDAIDSVVAQDYYRTEIIVVWDSDEPIPNRYRTGYPFVNWIRRSRGQPLGAGRARNRGAATAKSKFLIFLDADDMLLPGYISKAISLWNQHHAIVYTDYVGAQFKPDDQPLKAIVGLASYDKLVNLVYVNARLHDFDPPRAAAQPTDPPFVWCPVTCLLPKAWFDALGGFNEDLESWEDWDLHIRLAKAGRPYYHHKDFLLFYRLYGGRRREMGRQNWQELALFERVGVRETI